MRTILLALMITAAIAVSCGGPYNICKKSERLDGEVIYAVPGYHCSRKVYMTLPDGRNVIIYGVPIEQPLHNIPVCKWRGKYYWVMP
jgi:hypothetical protein